MAEGVTVAWRGTILIASTGISFRFANGVTVKVVVVVVTADFVTVLEDIIS